MDSDVIDLDATEFRDIFGNNGIVTAMPEKKQPAVKKSRRQVSRKDLPSKSTTRYIDVPNTPLTVIERNLENYLNQELRNCAEDVIDSITRIFEESDTIASIVPTFLASLKQEIRDLLILNDRHELISSKTIFDDFGMDFLQAFRKAEIAKYYVYSSGSRAIRTAHAAIDSAKFMVESSLSSSLTELTKSIKSLHSARKRVHSHRMQFDEINSKLSVKIQRLEAKKFKTEVELELVAKSLADLEESKRGTLSSEDFDQPLDIYGALEQTIGSIKAHMRNWGEYLPPWKIQEITKLRTEMLELRGKTDTVLESYLQNQQVLTSSPPRKPRIRRETGSYALDTADRKLLRMQNRRETGIENLLGFLSRLRNDLEDELIY